MKQEITISELAALMQVSTHQIRYFEEKGVLPPAYADDNGYRMYGIDEVYQLSHILLLRKLGLSVQAIREWMEKGTEEGMQHLLQQSVSTVEQEIERLQQLSGFMTKVLEEYDNFGRRTNEYMVTNREALPLSCWIETGPDTALSARMLVQQDSTLARLHESDLHYVYTDTGSLQICVQSGDTLPDLVLPQGEYLTCRFTIGNEEELDRHLERFLSYADEHSIPLGGPLVLAEKSYLSLFTRELLHYELSAPISGMTHVQHRTAEEVEQWETQWLSKR
ncbi:transcriptional regulator [Paenibacillus sp. PK3_47]|uniref:MerR family transcriptional regulator n=1 Tax=Paenibacillus sp. PK3_47 TaxID=2072642 RepID=UPI00201D73F5|nr:MerR family transcriptional regulator [Paenibacillus sp. PK3_47]UQZ32226.1 transcriptional regulator [Paenibacillus sp. PK3_47]